MKTKRCKYCGLDTPAMDLNNKGDIKFHEDGCMERVIREEIEWKAKGLIIE